MRKYSKNKHLERQLNPSQQYMLYCDKGVMSRLHAMHLKDEGYENIKVYRP